MTDHVVLPPETVLLSILETRLKDEFKNNVNVGIYYDIEGTQKPDNTRLLLAIAGSYLEKTGKEYSDYVNYDINTHIEYSIKQMADGRLTKTNLSEKTFYDVCERTLVNLYRRPITQAERDTFTNNSLQVHHTMLKKTEYKYGGDVMQADISICWRLLVDRSPARSFARIDRVSLQTQLRRP